MLDLTRLFENAHDYISAGLSEFDSIADNIQKHLI